MGKIGPENPRLTPTPPLVPDIQQPSTSKNMESDRDFIPEKRPVKIKSQAESEPLPTRNRFSGLETDNGNDAITQTQTRTQKYTIRADLTDH